MNCTKCGKEIPDGEKKICDECQKKLLKEMENETKEELVIEGNEKLTENSSEEIKVEKKAKNKGSLLKKILVAIIFIAIIILVCFIFQKNNNEGVSFILNIFKGNNEGNTIANIRNYGYTAQKGKWIYYVAPSEDGKEISIYKSKKDGSERTELVKDTWDVLGLNVVGKYMYFIGISDEEVEKSSTLGTDEASLDTLNNTIYRMKLDGTELEAINSNEFHNNCYEIYVIKDKIYYIGVDSNIYYMNLDGSNKTKLNDDATGFLGITEDYIIFNLKKAQNETETTTESTAYETYIMNLDGSDRKSLTGKRLYSINVVNDYIYYVDSTKAIYKVKVDGTENTLISDSVTAYNMNVNNNKIYYMSYTSDTQDKIAIYAMNLDGSDNKIIYELSNYSSFLNIIDNKIIFMDSDNKSATINMINSDGAERTILYELKQENVSTETTTETTPETTSENVVENTTTSTTTDVNTTSENNTVVNQ